MYLEKYTSMCVVMLICLSVYGIGFVSSYNAETSNVSLETISKTMEEVLDDNLKERVLYKSAEEEIEVVVRLTPFEIEDRKALETLDDEKRDNEAVDGLKEHSERKQAEVINLLNRHGGEVLNTFWIVNAVLAEVEVGVLDDIAAHPEVWMIHEDFELEVNTGSNSFGPLNDPEPSGNSEETTWGLDRIDVKGAWEEGEIWEDGFDGSSVRVAVSDTGVDIDHPDLEGKMVTVEEEDPYYPGGWIEFDEDGNVVENSTPRDTHQHGTHVSGTILGENASGKHIGVAPGAELMHALVFQEGSGDFSQMVASFEWKVEPYDRHGEPLHEKYGGDVEDYRAHIASMSWSSPGYRPPFEESIRNLWRSGVIPVAAVGNRGEGAVDSPGAIYESFAIGASEEDDEIAWFSSGDIVEDEREETPERYIKPDFAAPGRRIESAIPGNDWRAMSGTSMATPHVAGTIALMLDADSDLSADEISSTLTMSSDYHLSGEMLPDREKKNTRYGHGIINAAKAVDCVSGLAIREPEDIGRHTALLRGEVLEIPPNDELDVFFRYREEEKDPWTKTESISIDEAKTFETQVDGLKENTAYEYQAVAETSGDKETTFSVTFSTHKDVEVFTWIPENVTDSSSILKGSVLDMYIDEVEVFFRYRKTRGEEWEETASKNISEPEDFESKIIDLDYKTSYEYQAVAVSGENEFTGEIIGFTTALPKPEWDEDRRVYLVSNIGELQWLENDLGRDVILQKDINASKTEGWYYGAGFNPIGEKGFYSFRGDFDGQGHVIKNLYINRPMRDNVGLFGVNYNPSGTDRSTKIENVSVVGANITGRDNVGALVGWNEGEVIDSHMEGKVRGEDNIGGLIGRNGEKQPEQGDPSLEGEVTNSTSVTTVSGEKRVGGLVGWNEMGYITSSSAEGEVTAEDDYVGGLVGESGGITGSYSTVDVVGRGDYVGGLVGYGTSVTSSFSRGDVTGKGNFTGGLGGVITAQVEETYSDGEVKGVMDVGGLVGMLGTEEYLYAHLQNSYALGEVTGEKDIGGLIGNNSGYKVESSFYHEDMPDCDVEGYGSLPLNDEEFGSISTFSTAEWDIEMIETQRDHPYLSMETDGDNATWLIQKSDRYYNFTIDSQEGGTTDPPEGTHTYYEHGKIVLEAVRTEGYYSTGWTGDVESSEEIIAVTADEDKEMTALFEEVDEEIRNWEHLYNIRYKLDGDFTLETDLDRNSAGYEDHVVADQGWEPIGRVVEGFFESFTGTFDGQGYEISDLRIDRPTESYVGLFAFLGEEGSIENARLSNVSVIGGGGLSRSGVGALVGMNGVPVSHSYTGGNMNGEQDAGGLIYDSHMTGSVRGNSRVGGLVGYNRRYVFESSADGEVSGESSVGGLVGANEEGSLSNSSATADVSGNNGIGALVGVNDGKVSNSHSTGHVSGEMSLGGLIGYMSPGFGIESAVVINSYATGNVSGEGSIGGLLGVNFGRVRDSYATGDVSGNRGLGALIGINVGGAVSNTHSTGDVSGDEDLGGLIGTAQRATDVSNSFAVGNVSGDTRVGGLIGRLQRGSKVSTSYTGGKVVGDLQVGGLIGLSNGSVSNSYAATELHEAEDIGGLIGKRGEESQFVEDSFWDIERSGIEESDGGTGLNTEEMTGERAVKGMDAFDFEETWETVEKDQDDAEKDGYPILRARARGDQLEFVYIESPSVITMNASDMTTDSAVLHGELTELGAADEVDVYFQYREEGEASWNETQDQTLSEPQGFNETLSDLRSKKVYEFRSVAEDYSVDEGKTHTFETEPSMYELTIYIEGDGDVDIEPGDREEYEEGSKVELTAIPDEHWDFNEWTGDYEGMEEEITITMDDHKEITAHFVEEPYFEVNITAPEDNEEFDEGQTVIVEYTVENLGDVEDTQAIEFWIGDEHICSEENVTLNGTHSGEFSWKPEGTGEFEVTVSSIDDSDRVNIYVAEDKIGPGIGSLWLIGVIAIAVVLIFILREMKKSDGEREGKEEGDI